jgi:protoporphyrinogen oxidase
LTNAKPHIVILGAGPAGIGAAFQLSRRQLARVTVLDQNYWVGGNAGSFEIEGMRVDYGSHRLHPACDPEVFADIQALLGEDLLDRPRHGQILLRDRWIHFPLKPIDLIFRLPPDFLFGFGRDLATKILRGRKESAGEDSFASALEAGLGRTICRDFYFPYAEKVWGLLPGELSSIQARKRVSAGSFSRMMKRVFSNLPGLRRPGTGRFFYPKHGYGQISEAFAKAARQAGANLLLNTRVKSIDTKNGAVDLVHYETEGKQESISANYVWSTIPITILAKSVRPAAGMGILQAAESIRYRAMILVYLVIEQDRFSEYDAHYFPESTISISRITEPKNYNNGEGPKNRTILCAEFPCSPDAPEWNKSDAELAEMVCDALAKAGIPIKATISKIVTRRLRQAYPIYQQDYEQHFQKMDEWLRQIQGLLTFGRQGLFVHDNTHHALYMAYAAVKCLDENANFDSKRWQAYRKIFDTHVVED